MWGMQGKCTLWEGKTVWYVHVHVHVQWYVKKQRKATAVLRFCSGAGLA